MSAVALAAVLSSCAAGDSQPFVSAVKAFNLTTRFIDAVRSNDASRVCSMTTANARHDLAGLLHKSGAPSGVNVCKHSTIASRMVRATAMRPFLGVLGFTKYMKTGGNCQSHSESVEWSQSTSGQYAVVVVRRSSTGVLIVDSIQLKPSPSVCGKAVPPPSR